MAKQKKTESISVGYWMFAALITWIPFVNLVLVPVFAFVGRNESKKNFFKALILWFIIFIFLHISLVLIVGWPEIVEFIKKIVNSNQAELATGVHRSALHAGTSL